VRSTTMSPRTRLARCLFLLALLLPALAPSEPQRIARAAGQIIVTSPPAASGCTLQDAVIAANTDQPAGGCPAGSGADTIILSGITYTVAQDEPAATPDILTITSDVTIEGNGATIVQGTLWWRLIGVNEGGRLTLRDVTVGPSVLQIVLPGGGIGPRSHFPEPPCGTGREGGVISNCGELHLIDTVVTEGLAYDGGAIYNEGELHATRATIADSRAVTGDGGGLLNFRGTVVMTDSVVRGNEAVSAGAGGESLNGGGIYNDGDITLVGTTVSGNVSDGDGGGIYSLGHAVLRNSTVSGNSAVGFGGGIFNGEERILTLLNLEHSTIANNRADTNANGFGDGGGLYISYGGGALLTGTLIAGNQDTPQNGGVGNIYPDVASDNGASLTINARWDADESVDPSLLAATLCVTGPSFPEGSCQEFDGAYVDTITWRNLRPGTYEIAERAEPGWYTPELPARVRVLERTASAVTIQYQNPDMSYAFFLPAVSIGSGLTGGASGTPAGRPAVTARALGDAKYVSTGGDNLIGDGRGSGLTSNEFGDQVGAADAPIDPRLGPLQDNGGPTPTHALLPGSPAIDTSSACPATDQRGVTRPQGAGCDIGAFEAP
jgi:hypothetical protein